MATIFYTIIPELTALPNRKYAITSPLLFLFSFSFFFLFSSSNTSRYGAMVHIFCRTTAEWKPSFFYRSGAAWSCLGVVLSVADTAESRLQNMAKYVASCFWLLFRLQSSVFVVLWCHRCTGGTPIALDRFNQTRFKLQCFLWRAPSLVEPCCYCCRCVTLILQCSHPTQPDLDSGEA